MVYPLTRFTLFPILRYFVSSVTGLKNLPQQGPFIVASNHISQVDALLIISTLFPKHKLKLHYIANSRGKHGFLEKTVNFKWAGCIPIDPGNPSGASLNEALGWLKRGDLVGIFPEGERSPNNTSLLRGHTGIARLAVRSQLPVLPIGIITQGEPHQIIKGEKRSRPLAAIKQYLFNGARTKLIIGRPLYFNQHKDEDINYKLLRQITHEIMDHIARLADKKIQPIKIAADH